MAKQNLDGLADRLKMARTRITPEVSQKDAGKIVGRSGPCIGQWELGKSEPGLNDLLDLAKFYGVAAEWLMGLDTPNARVTENVMLASRGVGANSLPVLSNGAIFDNEAIATEYVQAGRAYKPGSAFAWKVDTDAMARFSSGDIAIIERSDELEVRGTYMIHVKGSDSPTLRRCRFDQQRPVFVADASSGFQSYNGDEVEIIGRLREIIKHIPIE